MKYVLMFPLADVLGEHHLLHAARAEMLRELGDAEGAAVADRRALRLVVNPAQETLLEQRLDWSEG